MIEAIKNLLRNKAIEKADSDFLSEDIKNIDDAFELIDRNRMLFDSYKKIYECKYNESELELFKNKNRSALFIPVVKDAIDLIASNFSSAFFTGRQAIEITGDDKVLVANLNRKIKKMLDISMPTVPFNQAFKSALIYGFACLKMEHKGNKAPKFECLPIDAFALDHRAVSLADSEYYCYRRSVSYSSLIKAFGKEAVSKVKAHSDPSERMEIRQIYHKRSIQDDTTKDEINFYLCRTYLDKNLINEDIMLQLPFFFGYAIPQVPDIIANSNYPKKIAYFGVSLVENLKAYQSEINKKRNQKIEADEFKNNPKILYTAGFPIDAVTSGPATAFQVNDLNSFKEFSNRGDVTVENDIANLKAEIREATGTNSVQYGATGVSDRRSANALEIIQASSGTRIETMVVTIKDTLFTHIAWGFVNALRMGSSDPDFMMLDTQYLQINFGTVTQTERRVMQLKELLQIELQSGNPNPELIQAIRIELATLLMGQDFDVNKLNPEYYGGV